MLPLVQDTSARKLSSRIIAKLVSIVQFMIVLGIETSCDDTGIALLQEKRNRFEILSNVVFSQAKLHRQYGGVYPSLAKREHQKNLPIAFKRALREGNVQEFDLIGVTVGPGLEPCLWQGINFAVDLAKKTKKPIVPVNHIEAHILTSFIDKNFQDLISNPQKLFPAVCLVVSGGHTELILMKSVGRYKLLGRTRDDAAGECFDKTARILGLGYPGGPAIARLANIGGSKPVRVKDIKLPRPMIYQKNYDFSFAGLKTAVLYDFRSRSEKERTEKKYIRAMCSEIQQAIIDVLIKKTLKAAGEFRVRSIILAGGVASNQELRRQMREKIKSQMAGVGFFVPPKNLCNDNGVMIALTAFFHQEMATKDLQRIKANAKLKCRN